MATAEARPLRLRPGRAATATSDQAGDGRGHDGRGTPNRPPTGMSVVSGPFAICRRPGAGRQSAGTGSGTPTGRTMSIVPVNLQFGHFTCPFLPASTRYEPQVGQLAATGLFQATKSQVG